MRFAFAGTPEFAAWVLSDLCELGRRPCLVITQPARPQGRGRCCRPSVAFKTANALGLKTIEAPDIDAEEVLAEIRSSGAEALVVAAFGQLIGQRLLESLLCVNVHASLLPAYRGAAPIERALMAGEGWTGVTIMRITEALDQGPVALQRSVSVELRDDAGSLGRVLAMMGALGVHQVLDGVKDGTVTWWDQEGSGSYAPKLTSRDCVLEVGQGAKRAHDQVRALSPRVGARARIGDLEVKLWRTWPYGEIGLDPVPPEGAAAAGDPGRLLAAKGRLFIGCEKGVLEVLVIQPAGRKKMGSDEFLRGYGARLAERLSASRPGEGEQCPPQAEVG